MPENYARVEVKLRRETKAEVEKLKVKLRRKGLKSVSNSRICEEIIEKFFRDGRSLEDGG